jgi:nucleotide-binding universal stress UspA family protein
MRLEKILYPTDFSECSRQALRHALFFAEQFAAELHMFHAVVLHGDDAAYPERTFPGGEEIVRAMTELSSSRLAEWLPEEERRALRVKEVTERGFSEADLILEYAAEQDVDIIVMGTHGRRGPRRLFLGSVAESVLRHADCPVLTLRESESEREIGSFERFLVPVDFSETSATGVAYGKQLAALYGASVQLLHVVHESTYPSVYGLPTQLRIENLEPRCLAAMDELMMSAPGPDVPFEKKVVSGRAAVAIVAFAARSGSDLVVIPASGASGLEKALLGSTADEVVRRAACPVLTVKPHGKSLLGDLAPLEPA